ncbi:MAG: type II toxin-antitoxin system mRNA interferase toxin, RelE/StbE family [Candidatus Brennerbacteria bacterium]|nr:type II toxin-antitoxin system mRNA interferase toxin, RelE/StbE family [Candidatus Brennerbacteria bacterium]
MKYKIIYGNKFIASAKKLEKPLKKKLDSQLLVLSENPFYPTLHTKPLSGPLKGAYSFRIGRDYRIIFIVHSNNIIQLLLAAHRKDIYK